MVGLSDIPFVGKALDRISDVAVDAVFRGFRYMFCYKDGINVLNLEIERLKIQEDSMSRKVIAERGNGKNIDLRVLKWQNDAEEIQETAKKSLEKFKNRPSWRCIPCMPISKPVSHFRLGREAGHISKTVMKLTDMGKELVANEIAHLPPVENLPKTDTDFQNFQSRKDAYGELWNALLTEGESLILGIYGLPGVGKTRMMEQIWKEAKGEGIFNIIARADVGGENLDVIKIQDQIAGYLQCNFEFQSNVENRASQLKNSLMNGGKVLVILDDVWSVIPLDIIGISFGDGSSSRGCKILLTAREEDVCLRNSCKHPVKLTTLRVDEVWDLFRNIVGTSEIDSLQDESLAQKVCNKCAGLPLLIRAVGKAVQFTTYNSWKDALDQLEKGRFENIIGIDPQVYACVKLSIDRLPDDAKSCLFICSLFRDDDKIHVRTLIQLAASSQLVPDGEFRIHNMVDFLMSSLLLECQGDHRMKLHDIIRDVGRSVAVRDPKYAFLQVSCGSRLPDNADYGTRKFLRLDLKSDDVYFPDDLVCPDLHNLWLHWNCYCIRQFSDGFYSIFANLKFLLVEQVLFSGQQQFSLQPLGKLSTLILDGCDVNQTTDSLFPKNLETLCIWQCRLPLWLHLPILKYLQKLEVIRKVVGERLYFVPNTISNLSNLEKLHIPYGFEIRENGSAVSVPILVEIIKLTRLTSLQMFFRDSEPFYTNIFCNLLEFQIRVGEHKQYFYHRASPVLSSKLIELSGYQLGVLESVLGRAEELFLWCTDVSICNSNRDAFADLKILYVQCCDTMELLARISKDEIQLSCQLHTSFSKLTTLEISKCSAMKYLFCNSVAKCLVQLQTLRRLTSFRGEKKNMSGSTSVIDNSAVQSVQSQLLFDGMVKFPALEHLHISNLEDAHYIWGKQNCNDNVSFCQIKSLVVWNCNKLESVIPVAMLHRLQNLEKLSIYSCGSLISEIGTCGSNTAQCQLVALCDMDLEDLPCLTKTGLNSMDYSGAMTLYPNLQHLKILDCDSLENVFLAYIARELIYLEDLSVIGCKTMKEIAWAGEQEITDDIVFPALIDLQLSLLPNLTSFWSYQSGEPSTFKVKFPNLVDFELSCGQINLESIELGRDDSSCELMSLNISSDNEIQLPSQWQPQLYNLDTLILKQCWLHEMKSLSFQRLRVFKVSNSGCSTLFTFSVFESLQQLQKLEIYNCALLEEIVEDVQADEPSGMDKKTITLFQLQSIILKDLPNLRSFIHGANYECHMPALKEVEIDNCGLSSLFTCPVFRNLQKLETLQVSNCRLLEGIVEDASGDETCDKTYKIITLFRLSKVVLKDLPDLKRFFDNANYECQMPDINWVEVYNCGLSTPFSVFPYLQQLENL
ncbi:NB-ARC domain-containing protein [Heracleum sosnowskyi]|uniref:NB-ARC domain-containing protein n=1 Tax=Heracleum sosnowskyi TaxID=360622 RepID=A0AAD8HJ29_9APIA|nr:NB-ARC domain-containing protein [Heracleum sosnowskyi]